VIVDGASTEEKGVGNFAVGVPFGDRLQDVE
jgi:hypothetical protein